MIKLKDNILNRYRLINTNIKNKDYKNLTNLIESFCLIIMALLTIFHYKSIDRNCWYRNKDNNRRNKNKILKDKNKCILCNLKIISSHQNKKSQA